MRLNTRTPTKRVAFFDVQISAPKDVSVLGVVAGDERVRREFYTAAQVAVSELERWAAVRERRGKAHNTEAVRLTRNLVAALFLHDTSRDLDPQLHVHAVIANVTWDAERQVWMALQPKLTEVRTVEVRQRQREELSEVEQHELDDLVQSARESPARVQISQGAPRAVLDAAIRHVFERRSVAREGDVLAAALELHPDFYRWRELREALDAHPMPCVAKAR